MDEKPRNIRPEKIGGRRIASGSRRLHPPPDTAPGYWWLTRSEPGPASQLDRLRQELLDCAADSPRQVAIEFSDEGEPWPLTGGDGPAWNRAPWKMVIWIGEPKEFEATLLRVVADSLVGSTLLEGATLNLLPIWGGNPDLQREQMTAIERLLASPPPARGQPLSDQACYFAVRAAAFAQGVPNKDKVSSTQETWPPDAGWHFQPGRFAFAFRVGKINGIKASLLDELRKARGPIHKDQLLKKVWPDSILEEGTLRGHISKVRDLLRSTFGLTKKEDPLPEQDHGKNLGWKIDEEMLIRISAESAPLPTDSQRT